MNSIKSIEVALPEYCYDNKAIQWAGKQWLGESKEAELFARFVCSAQTKNRFFVSPLEKILSLNGQEERANIFENEAPKLGIASAARAIAKAGLDKEQLASFVFTSCTCPAIPSIDTKIIEELKLSQQISRVPVYQFGCAGGVQGLALANKLATDGKSSLLTSVELCSLIYQKNDLSPGHLVGAAIFGDGSASVVISPSAKGNKELEIVSSQSFLLPNTRHLMGYDLSDDGAHLRLDKSLPDFLSTVVGEIVVSFLEKQDLSISKIKNWLFHPGGKKILDQLEQTFVKDPTQNPWSREVLNKVGNLSSSTVLFVLKEYLENANYQTGDEVVLLGIGPGLTVELILFRHN